MTLRLLSRHYPRCQPQWKVWEFKHKIRQAAKRGTSEWGKLANAERRTGT